MEKFKEFIRKNKIIVTSAAILIVLVMAGAGVSLAANAIHANDNRSEQTTQTQAEQQTASQEVKEEDTKSLADREESAKEEAEIGNTDHPSETKDENIEDENTEDANIKDENTEDKNTADEKKESAIGGTGSASTGGSETDSSNGSGSSNEPVHQHQWKDHMAQRWVSNIVTVVDEPEKTQKVTLYRMYWWDSKQWTETKDSTVFEEWSKKKMIGCVNMVILCLRNYISERMKTGIPNMKMTMRLSPIMRQYRQ